jgi:hypothetical protein
MQRSLCAFLLVLAFLVVQGGMTAHAISHLPPPSPSGNDDAPAQDAECELCMGYAQLAGSVPAPAPIGVPDRATATEASGLIAVVLVSRSTLHSHARAPPSFYS